MINWSQYTVPEIKIELKKRGLVRTGKKADLVQRLTTAIENERFVYFPELPAELRRRVWGFALPRRRIIELNVVPWHGISVSKARLGGAMTLLLTCKESHEVTQRYHQPAELAQNDQAVESPGRSHRFLYHDDVFFFDDMVAGFNSLRNDHGFSLDANRVKILAFPVEDMENFLLGVFKPAEEMLRELVHRFTALEQIILIEEKRDQPKESKRKMSFATAFFAAANPPRLSIPSWMPSYREDSSDESFTSIVEVVQEIVSQEESLKAFKSIKIHYAEFT